MKWFHHDTDIRHKEAIAKLKAEFGFEGIGRYWTICEIIAEQMDYSDKCFAEFPETKWLSELVIRRPLFRRYLQVIGQLFDNRVIINGSLIRIEMPNLLEKKDNHSRNLQAKKRKLASKDKDKDKEKEKPKPLKKRPPKNKTNPDIKTAIDHFHNEYFRVYGVEPDITGAHGKIFEGQLKKRTAADTCRLITLFLNDRDKFLLERCHPIELFLNRINKLLVSLGKSKYQERTNAKKQAAQIVNIVELPKLEDARTHWRKCLETLQTEILPESFSTWLAPAFPIGRSNGTIYVCVPNQFFKKCIEENYQEMIVKNIGGGISQAKFLTRDEYKLND